MRLCSARAGPLLLSLGEPEAEERLREARELLASLAYKTALTETEALLAQGEATAV